MSVLPLPSSFVGLRVLVVEDMMALAIQYRTLAVKLGVEVISVGTHAEALRRAPMGPWHAALVDLHLPDGSGFDVMAHVLRAQPECSVVVITAQDSLDNAVRASEAGAFDYIEKPVEAERLLVTLRNALNASRMAGQVASLQTKSPQQFEQFIGQSAAMQTVYTMIETVAASHASVCITGESGTGKELAAQAIHARSSRHHKKLVVINCAAIAAGFIESELFGHVKGAFTGAVSDRPGAFIEAHEGTLFLDEVAELDLSVQSKLLRALQMGEVKRLGSDQTRVVDVRLVCATHRNLMDLVRAQKFREDLFYRLYVVPIELPPLRLRGDDIALIAQALLERYAKEEGKSFTHFCAQALVALRAHSWPGNVRELVNVIRAAVAMNNATTLDAGMLAIGLRSAPAHWFSDPQLELFIAPAPKEAVLETPVFLTDQKSKARLIRPLADLEREAVHYALGVFQGNVAQAARALKINPSTLYRKIQAWSAQGLLGFDACAEG
jgi:two-component system, repressor protein LuxO